MSDPPFQFQSEPSAPTLDELEADVPRIRAHSHSAIPPSQGYQSQDQGMKQSNSYNHFPNQMYPNQFLHQQFGQHPFVQNHFGQPGYQPFQGYHPHPSVQQGSFVHSIPYQPSFQNTTIQYPNASAMSVPANPLSLAKTECHYKEIWEDKIGLKKNGVKKLFDKLRDMGGDAWRSGYVEIEPGMCQVKVSERKKIKSDEERVRKVC